MRGAAAGAAHTPHPAPWTTRATAVDTAAATAAPTSMLERPLPFSVLGSRAPASALGARMITGCLASTDGKTDHGPPAIAHRDGGRRRGPQRAPRPQAQAAERPQRCGAPCSVVRRPGGPGAAAHALAPHAPRRAAPLRDVPLGLGRARRSVDVYRNIRRHPYSPYTF